MASVLSTHRKELSITMPRYLYVTTLSISAPLVMTGAWCSFVFPRIDNQFLHLVYVNFKVVPVTSLNKAFNFNFVSGIIIIIHDLPRHCRIIRIRR